MGYDLINTPGTGRTKGNTMATTLLLDVQPNAGYSPEQVERRMTLAELMEAIEYAIDEYGDDAEVVLNNGQRYGAQFGYIAGRVDDLFYEADDNDDDF